MGYSNVEVANQALDHLGKENIASFTESSTAARKVNEVFTRTMHAALSRSTWSFARKIASLASVANDWEERWDFKYDDPNDLATMVRLVPVVDMTQREVQIPYERMGSSIYTNESPAKAEYVFTTTGTQSMPTYFLDAVSLLLARNLCMPLTRKRSEWKELNGLYETTLALAINIDAGQEPVFWVEAGGGAYMDARGGGVNYGDGNTFDGSRYWS